MIKSVFRQSRIQKKFALIMTTASGLALMLAASTMVIYEQVSYKASLINEFNVQGDIVKEHLDVAMSFNDAISASESLAAFGSNGNIMVALVVYPDGSVFASYVAEGGQLPENGSLKIDYNVKENSFQLNHYIGVKEITSANQALGFLYVEYKIPPLFSRVAKYVPLLLITALTLFFMNVIVSMGVYRFIIRPIRQLTDTAMKISEVHDYSLRTGLCTEDEVGDLSGTLDELLEVTEKHQNTMLAYNRQLEAQSSELEQQHRQVAEANKEYQDLLKSHELLLHSANEGIIGLDINGKITFVNPRAARILELEAPKLKDTYMMNYFLSEVSGVNGKYDEIQAHDLYAIWLKSNIQQSIAGGECCHCEDEIWQTSNSTKFHVGYNFAAILNAQHKCTGGVLVFEDITLRKNDEMKLSELANFDSLTNLANRRFFYDSMYTAITRSKHEEVSLALLYIDIDRFKQINDTYGHEGGDQVLLEVARSLRRCTRENDLVSRLAGDEFAILLNPVNEPAEVQQIAEKVLENLSKPYIIDGNHVYVTCSIGIAMYPDTSVGSQSEDLLRAADAAMYQVKKRGREGIQFFNQSLQKEVETQNRILHSLSVSNYDKDFTVLYQPKISLIDGRICGAEALLRWSYEGESIPPDIFIPIAEESGQIGAIGEWVLNSVCKQIKLWQLLNSAASRDLCISVNVSPKQFRLNNFAEVISKVLNKYAISPACLEIEITETAMMEDPESVRKELQRIRNLGVKISIDDFGTGYSSLNYLKRLPIDTLKIDRSFIIDIGNEDNDEAIVRAVIGIANSLNLAVIAEGVETEEQLAFLDNNQCDQVQGYFFSKPLLPDEFHEFCEDHFSENISTDEAVLALTTLEKLFSDRDTRPDIKH